MKILRSAGLCLAAAGFLLLQSFIDRSKNFEDEQLKNSRVAAAKDEKDETLKKLCAEKGIAYPVKNIFIRAFKKEAQLEVWAAGSKAASYKLLKTYKICTVSGVLGPKRKEGDEQTPEGFYRIRDFNPQSTFYLSLGLNYPNASDKIKTSDKKHPGGAIYIHGNCVSIGCMPITNDGIKELYWLAVKAKAAGQGNIEVHVFPFRMSEENMKWADKKYENNKPLLRFWKNLKTGYDHFEKKKRLPAVSVARNGSYIFS